VISILINILSAQLARITTRVNLPTKYANAPRSVLLIVLDM
jgi:hypothetical protein